MIYITEDCDGNYIQQERFTHSIERHNYELIKAFLQTKQLEGLSNNTLDEIKPDFVLVLNECNMNIKKN